MPDSTSLPLAEGGRQRSSGPNWLLIGGVGVVGVVLVLFVAGKGSQGTTGTTSGMTSINAALGSIQEENLNTIGLVGKSRQDILDALASGNAQIMQDAQTHENNINGELQTISDNVILGRSSQISYSADMYISIINMFGAMAQ